ncbi:MAG: glycosyltransferase involved in cell wall biosynthesis [Bacteroidia bacterium]|jgi:glycosyltransferase involved in cell wall biosynthesis
MRILQVVPSLIRGGAERLVLNLTKELETKGHEVKIFALHDDNLYTSLNSKTVVVITPARVSYSLLGQDTSDTELFDKAVREFNPDVIHSHLIEAEFISRHQPNSNTVYVSHWHGCPEMLRKAPLKEFLKKDTWWNWNSKRNLIRGYRECGNHFLCISEFMKGFVVEHLDANPNDCTIISNAVDTDLFSPNEQTKDDGILHLIAVGKLNHNKNQQFLVKVVAELKKQNIEADLTLLGSGAEEPKLKKLANHLGVASKIFYSGTVDNPEEYLNQADVLVHASHYEAFGLVLLEAMACAKPVVCFNDGGPAEVAVNELNGLVVERGDVTVFANAVAQLATDKELYAKLSAQALEFSKDYGLKQYAEKVYSLYEKLVSER